jgi:sugar transferase (PEP-CTERM/EpsH1 system associated)
MKKPLIAHLIYCLDTGGLERVMLNCIRQMNGQDYQHVVISLTYATEFAAQLPPDVAVYCLHKKPGADLAMHWRLWRLLREIRPDILHSYNLATLEYHPVAWLAGVSGHLHAEHGRDISDPKGENKKYQWLRRLMSPFLHCYVAVSGELHQWLGDVVKIKPGKNRLIYNGINLDRFVPQQQKAAPFTFIHVARLATVKDQHTLLHAIALLCTKTSQPFQCWLVGDGPERQRLQQTAADLGLAEPQLQWLGERQDIAVLMAQSQVFVLSSVAEGIPMTVLEAMACGLAIVATDVGGLPELISQIQGRLVPARDPQALADAMLVFLTDPAVTSAAGTQCRERVCRQFSEQAMVAQYLALYREINQ